MQYLQVIHKISIDSKANSVYMPLSLDCQDCIASMRGFAILTIVFGHVGGYWAFQPFSSYLHTVGSTFFFFLSGAVLFHSYSRSKSLYVYMIKRFSNLLIPYYLICLLALLVYILNNNAFPFFDSSKALNWIMVHPVKEIMPFPLGQLWFLRTYLLLFVISPFIFFLYQKSIFYILFLYGVLIILAVLQRYYFIFTEDNLVLFKIYSISFYSCFFIFGAVLYSGRYEINSNYNYLFFLIPISIFIITVNHTDITDNFTKKDIVALSSTFMIAGFTFLYKKNMIKFLRKYNFILNFFQFYHRHTFSVYLLHSFAIFIIEMYPGFINPQSKGVAYGLTKFVIVLAISSLLAIPFTRFSKSLSGKLLMITARSV